MGKRIVFLLSAAMAFGLSSPAAHACSAALSNTVASILRPFVEASEPCQDFRITTGGGCLVKDPFGGGCAIENPKITAGIDNSRVYLRSFHYCPRDGITEIDALVNVRCETSRSAMIKTHLEEDIQVTATIEDSSCTLRDFHFEPTGEVAKHIARASGATDRLRGPFEDMLAQICQ